MLNYKKHSKLHIMSAIALATVLAIGLIGYGIAVSNSEADIDAAEMSIDDMHNAEMGIDEMADMAEITDMVETTDVTDIDDISELADMVDITDMDEHAVDNSAAFSDEDIEDGVDFDNDARDYEAPARESEQHAPSQEYIAIHKVIQGDTLLKIAHEYYTNIGDKHIDEIIKANGLPSRLYNLKIGMELIIPYIDVDPDPASVPGGDNTTTDERPERSEFPKRPERDIPEGNSVDSTISIKLTLPDDRTYEQDILVKVEITPSDTGIMVRILNRRILIDQFPVALDIPVPTGGSTDIEVYYNDELMQKLNLMI